MRLSFSKPLLLPGVTEEMLLPEFWTARFRDIELEAGWIGTDSLPPLNSAVASYLETVRRQSGALYNGDGSALAPERVLEGCDWWERYEYGLLTKTADLKLLPRDAPFFSTKGEPDLDRNQLSGLDPGEALLICGVSPDRAWLGVVSDAGTGWVKRDNIGIGSRNEILAYQNAGRKLTAIDPNPVIRMEDGVIGVSMGSSFPLADERRRLALVPGRDATGKLKFKTGIITEREFREHLPRTAYYLIRQAFKYLGCRYAWGDHDLEGYGRDCSRLVRDVLRSIGFKPPRNSQEQLAAGKKRTVLTGMDLPRRIIRLKTVSPGSLLFTSDHVMFFLGEYQGEFYAIHGFYNFRRKAENKEERVKVKQVVVSGVSLGSGTEAGSLLERLTTVIEV